MANKIEWITNPESAFGMAEEKNIPVFLDFFNTQ